MNPLVTKRCSPIEEMIYQDGFQAGAASRDAEVAQWQKIIDEEAKDSALVIIERDQLRAELVKALAACKVKDEALASCGFTNDSTDSEMCGSYYDAELVQRALAIKPDDSALKAWLGAPVAWADAYGNVIRKSTKEFSRNSMTAAYSIALYSPNLPLGETK